MVSAIVVMAMSLSSLTRDSLGKVAQSLSAKAVVSGRLLVRHAVRNMVG
jgi:hypothetical protein